jgi:hypothetical protein
MSVTIAATSVPNWQRDSDVVLRIYALTSFIAADGTIVVGGNTSQDASLNDNWFANYTCTVSSGNLSIPAVTLPSTTDSLDVPSAVWSAAFFTVEGEFIAPFGQFARFPLTPSPSSTTWAAIAATLGTTTGGTQAPPFFFAGAWSNTQHYGMLNVVTYQGSSWIALAPSIGVIPVAGAVWALLASVGSTGAPGPIVNWRGAYATGTTYALYDSVSFNGSSYLSIQTSNTGNSPASSGSWWGLIAAGGSGGAADPDALAISVQGIVDAMLSPDNNLFDKAQAFAGQIPQTFNGALSSPGSFDANAFGASALIEVIPGEQYYIAKGISLGSASYGINFFSRLKVWDSGHSIGGAVTDGQVVTVPAGDFFMQIPTNPANKDIQHIKHGASAPAAYKPFLGSFPAPTFPLTGGTGKKMGVLGDSQSTQAIHWQDFVAAKLGVIWQAEYARTGRTWQTAFEGFGQPVQGAALSTFGGLDLSYVYPGVGGTSSTYNDRGLTNGQTLAALLATIDFLIIRLGANNGTDPVGALFDSISTASQYGGFRWVGEMIMTARPNLRILVVGPTYDGYRTPAQTKATDAMMADQCREWSWPYLSMIRCEGNNPFIESIAPHTFTYEGTHDNGLAVSQNIGPVIAGFLNSIL